MKMLITVIQFLVVLLAVIYVVGYSIQSHKTAVTKELIPVMENLKSPFDPTAQLYEDCFVLVSKQLPQSEQDIKYVWSKDESYMDGDTLETHLFANNNMVKIFDNKGLAVTVTVSKFWSQDNLFDGYVTWSKPVWNTKNPNIQEDQEDTLGFWVIYRKHVMQYLASEFGVFGGWNPQMPAHFINRRNGYKDEGRNIHYFQTITPVSKFDYSPLQFWAECGDVDLKQVTGKSY